MKFKVALFAVVLLALSAFSVAQNVNPYGPVSDPCQNPQFLKLGAPVAITTATTTELVPAVAGKFVYVCSYALTSVGTGTVQFKTGTKVSTACDTGATNLTGAFLIPTTTMQTVSGDRGVQFASVGSGEVCITTASGVTSVNGYITYVQK